jgi:hypothetical protein
MASCTWLQVGAQGEPCERYSAIVQDVWPPGDVPQEAGNPRMGLDAVTGPRGCQRRPGARGQPCGSADRLCAAYAATGARPYSPTPFPRRSAWLELLERPAEGTLADEVDAQPESLGERPFYPFRRFFRVLEVAFEAAEAHPRALSVAESHDIEAVRRRGGDGELARRCRGSKSKSGSTKSCK